MNDTGSYLRDELDVRDLNSFLLQPAILNLGRELLASVLAVNRYCDCLCDNWNFTVARIIILQYQLVCSCRQSRLKVNLGYGLVRSYCNLR